MRSYFGLKALTVWEALMKNQVRLNRGPEKVWKKVWEALAQSQVKFNRVAEKVPEKIPDIWEALVQSQVRFNNLCICGR